MKAQTRLASRSKRWRAFITVFAMLVATLTSMVTTTAPAQAATGNILPPFDIGQTWNICQGYGGAVSHTGTYRYGIDLTGAGCDNSASGRNVRTPLGGTVAYYQAAYGNLCINTSDGRSITLTHINSSITGGAVSAGQIVGTVAAPGQRSNAGVAHIHLQMWSTPGCYSNTNGGIPFDSAHNARICGAPDLVPGASGSNGQWSGTSFTGQSCSSSSPTPPPVDYDGDGTPDASDQCPVVSGPPTNTGCAKYNQPMAGDFNKDGRTDKLAFYNHGGGAVDLKLWTGNTNGTFSQPTQAWYVPSGSGWDGSRLIPAGVGDLNGDGNLDAVAFYRYDNAALGLNAWYGNGQGGFTYQQGWYVSSGWFGDRIIPAGIGDYNKDGRDDVAAFYRYDNAALGLKVWSGNSNGMYTAPAQPWYAPSGWDGFRVIPVGAGDYNGDGNIDIAVFFRYDSYALEIKRFSGNGSGGFAAASGWYVAQGWDGQRIIPGGSTDFNGDGRADIAAYYDYGGGSVGIKLWNGASDGALVPVSEPWYVPAGTGWYGNRIQPAGVGDFNGDGKRDLASFYLHDGWGLELNL